MLTYYSLTKSQKRWVEAVSRVLPGCVESGIITGQECDASFYKLLAERTTGGEKVGYPNWLFTTNKLKRGVYLFPAKGVTTQTVARQNQNSKVVQISDREVSAEDQKFFADLATFGVEIKTDKK